jgi:hypothetical protein
MADDRIDHLLVKTRIRIGRFEAAIAHDVWMIEIDRWIKPLALEILIDDGDSGADRTGLQRLERNAQDKMIAAAPAAQRVERVHPERAVDRLVFAKWIRPAEWVAIVGRHHVISTR